MPLHIHLLISTVVQNFCASAVAAVGGNPVLSRNMSEVGFLSSDALLLNTGIWNPEEADVFELACKSALARSVPVVLDPVGAGFSKIRRDWCRNLLQSYPGKIFLKGNPSEFIALASDTSTSRGVDSDETTPGSIQKAIDAAVSLQGLCSGWLISGPLDYIGAAGEEKHIIEGGAPVMSRVVGTGCLLGSIIAFQMARSRQQQHSTTKSQSTISAALEASQQVKKAGASAAVKSTGPGTFPAAFIDALGEEL